MNGIARRITNLEDTLRAREAQIQAEYPRTDKEKWEHFLNIAKFEDSERGERAWALLKEILQRMRLEGRIPPDRAGVIDDGGIPQESTL